MRRCRNGCYSTGHAASISCAWLATKSQNAANTPKLVGNFKGVNWRPKSRRWRASIKVNDRHQHLGYFDTEPEAARAYDLAAIEVFGEFAFLNFPEELRP